MDVSTYFVIRRWHIVIFLLIIISHLSIKLLSWNTNLVLLNKQKIKKFFFFLSDSEYYLFDI